MHRHIRVLRIQVFDLGAPEECGRRKYVAAHLTATLLPKIKY
jgi:hypothetical protein